MQFCPRCKIKLNKTLINGSFFWSCPLCDGRVVSMEVLRKYISISVVKDLWSRSYSSTNVSDIHCPICCRNMNRVALKVNDNFHEIDICQSCRFVWFDKKEFQDLPKIAPEGPVEAKMPIEARKALAISRIESIKNKYEIEEMVSGTPDHLWEYILGFIDFPVEHNNSKLNNLPIITWFLAAIIVLVAIISSSNLDAVVNNWALIPSDFTRHYGLTLISSFLIHGGIMHLVGNLYFLIVFGDNVEDMLGPRRYILLIFLSSLGGDIAHIFIDPRSSIPVIGASGGISGLLAYYCLSFPKAKIGFLRWYRWFRIPVSWMFFFWVAGQFIGAINQVSGFGKVSSLAHLGGASIGLIYWWASAKQSDRGL